MEKDKLIQRLRRIEGQVRGLQRMVEGRASCSEILTRGWSPGSALSGVTKMIFETYSELACIQQALNDEAGGAEAMGRSAMSLSRLIK